MQINQTVNKTAQTVGTQQISSIDSVSSNQKSNKKRGINFGTSSEFFESVVNVVAKPLLERLRRKPPPEPPKLPPGPPKSETDH